MGRSGGDSGWATMRWLLFAALCVPVVSCKARFGCSGDGAGATGNSSSGSGDTGGSGGGADAGACTPKRQPKCGGQRWVGLRKPAAASCPLSPASAAAGWAVKPLATGKLPDGLARTCIYTRATNAASADMCAIEAELVPPAGLESLTEECQRVYPFGIEEDLATTFRSALHAQSGGVRSFDPAPRSASRVVAADTDPDLFNGSPQTCADSHGCTMAHVAKDMLCPQRDGGPCGGEVGWALALPHTSQGVRHGYPSELAAAALGAFNAWRTDMKTPGTPVPPHLVLNMSLGWESDAKCDEDGGPRAVADALRYLACNGVLEVAAAGNAHVSGNAPAQMACPARLEVESLSDGMCQGLVDASLVQAYATRLGVEGQPWQSFLPGAPLLYAAGGLDYLDRPIEPFRPSARPVLAAPALGGASWGSPLGTPAASPAHAPLAGTSVSAAVVSGAAAAIWAFNPRMRTDEVMKRLADTADQAGAGAAGTTPGTAISIASGARRLFGYTSARRISLCKALGQTCPALSRTGTNPGPGSLPAGTTAQTVSPSTGAACAAPPANMPGVVTAEPNDPRCPHCMLSFAPNNSSQPPELTGTLLAGPPLSCLSLFVKDANGAVQTFNLNPAGFGGGTNNGPGAVVLGGGQVTSDTRAWLVWGQADPSNAQQTVSVGQAVYLAPR